MSGVAGQPEYNPVQMADEAIPMVEDGKNAVKAVQTVEVVAPANLPEGYSFEANIGEGRVIAVTVPLGGVEQGQRFTVAAKDIEASQGSRAPVGAWKDGLCDCCVYGCCHPQLCLTCWAGPCALAQVMQRLNLNWQASPAGPGTPTFKTIFWIVGAYIATMVFLGGLMGAASASDYQYDPNTGQTSSNGPGMPGLFLLAYFLSQILKWAFIIYILVIATKTRAYIRNKYAIPEQCCHGCEDCCVAFWCTPCSTCQMARHTADYDTYRGMCCTSTGLPPTAPSIV